MADNTILVRPQVDDADKIARAVSSADRVWGADVEVTFVLEGRDNGRRGEVKFFALVVDTTSDADWLVRELKRVGLRVAYH